MVQAIRSKNKSEYNVMSLKELIDNRIGFTITPNELKQLGIKYDPTHFFVMFHCLSFANSKTHEISIANISKALNIGKEKVGKVLNNLIKEGYMKREPYYEGRLRKGFVYTVYANLDLAYEDNTSVSWDFCCSENQDTKKTNNKTKKENGLFVNSNKEKKNYKDTKLEVILNSFRENGIHLNTKLKNLIKNNVDEFDSDVFEKIFENIANSRNKINNLFSYLNKTFNTLKEKNIKTLEEFIQDQKVYFRKKLSEQMDKEIEEVLMPRLKRTKKINQNIKRARELKENKQKQQITHNNYEHLSQEEAYKIKREIYFSDPKNKFQAEPTFLKYKPDELERILFESQKNKFK